MPKIYFCFLIIALFAINRSVLAYNEETPETIEHKQELSIYIDNFCQGKGRSYVRVQNNIVVDCLTADTLWKIEYADNWPQALVKAMTYSIYDNYLGDEEFAPKPGVVLVQEDSDDYRNMVQLKQIVNHYKLPVNLNIIENYAPVPPSSAKNIQIDVGKRKFFIMGD